MESTEMGTKLNEHQTITPKPDPDSEVTASGNSAELSAAAKELRFIKAVAHEVVGVLAPRIEEIFSPKLKEISEVVSSLHRLQEQLEARNESLDKIIERCPRVQGNGADCSG